VRSSTHPAPGTPQSDRKHAIMQEEEKRGKKKEKKEARKQKLCENLRFTSTQLVMRGLQFTYCITI